MNTERAAYRAEDDEGDDSAAVSFGSGPAFRPVPRIERPAPSAPEKPPRLPEGLLFDRASQVIRTEAAKQAQAEKDKSDSDKSDKERPLTATSFRATPPPASVAPQPRTESSPAQPIEAAEEAVELQGPDTHLPDIGEFTGTLPDAPAIPLQRVSVEQFEVPERTETEPPVHTYPMETVADIPEWPEQDADTADPPPQPVPPRQSPVFSPGNQAETAAFNVPGDQAETPAAASGTGGGGGGGRPPGPPPSAGGVGPAPESGEPPFRQHNTLYGSGVGGGSAGYNPNAAPTPVVSAFEQQAPTIIQKKGSMWPYVAVLAENIARKRADRKLKKELSGRMDQQDKVQEESHANQLRIERQQQQMLDEQRRQSIRDAHRPSGREWGVPQYPAPGAGREGLPGVPPVGAERLSPAAGQQSGETQEELADMQGERVKHSAWHTYIEGKSNQEAAQTLHYGEGFRREQKEIVRDHTGDSVAAGVAGTIGTAHALGGGFQGGAAGGGANGAGGAAGGSGQGQAPAGGSYYGQGGEPYTHSLPSGMTTPGLPGGTHPDVQHQLPPRLPKKPTAHMPGPLFWLMVALIIVAFFAASFI